MQSILASLRDVETVSATPTRHMC